MDKDRHYKVKYTDVDYIVFTDASRLIVDGSSPFARATYRYTPLLGLLLTPNILFTASFGKCLFAACDLLVGWVIYKLLILRKLDHNTSLCCASAWLLNPMSFGISTRGNAESIICSAVLCALWMLETKRVLAAGTLLGLAIHLKIYPILYTLPMYLWLGSSTPKPSGGQFREFLYRLAPNFRQIKLVVSCVLSFCCTTYACYLWCGDAYLEEAWIYHVRRTDNRHNFSAYFYPLYLSFGTDFAKMVGLAAFVPQAILSLVIGASLFHDLPLTMFLQTFVFVTFNKVCTSQYFLWYICLLPLVAHHKATTLTTKQAVKMTAVWFGCQGLWLLPAYFLEFEGVPTFIYLWAAGLALMCGCAWIVVQIICHSTVVP
ncbi:hypothetical protein SARC_04348 [Sphaeroforma arctica JP610]|uniref:GPI mannosyltransferase 1 n=1 Tax=Sphaeroforma arctica JP610 TaxID=667725 RepID=A0A0L0G2P2_9EUKA|nr:hypothetical protein SARC_04348 [Sphaeroforma arctica JP610]KNC83407.1 hypothetical protein SARC_04348 [Sphaeroforma arctica JP610]|eukprot:XP_014157309.1 hypothetical protein SARC_04348 [Sphaeroforma arctica JP610]